MCPESPGVVTWRRRLQSNGWRLAIPGDSCCCPMLRIQGDGALLRALLKAALRSRLIENDLHSRKRMGSVANRSQLVVPRGFCCPSRSRPRGCGDGDAALADNATSRIVCKRGIAITASTWSGTTRATETTRHYQLRTVRNTTHSLSRVQVILNKPRAERCLQQRAKQGAITLNPKHRATTGITRNRQPPTIGLEATSPSDNAW